jgi:hypothetical protein
VAGELASLLEQAAYARGVLMATQQTVQQVIDNAVNVLNAFFTNADEVIGKLQAEGVGQPPADTSALQAIIDQVPGMQAELDALVPQGTTSTGTGTSTTHTTGTTSS